MAKNTKKDVGAIYHDHGTTFRVWAPFAKEVSVTGSFNGWSRTPLTSEEDGYWSTSVDKVRAGSEYKFVINTGEHELFKNDPRSLQVTTSIGNSVVVDQEFDWEGDDFKAPSFNEQVIYEMHIGTFHRPDPAMTGTFASASEKLDYLSELGVNMVELMPIGTMPMDRGWGYATDYIYAIESLYGGRRGFLEFVRAAHQKGIGVIVDVVYNHFGPDGGFDLWQFDGWNENGKGGIYFYNDWRSKTPWGDTRPDYGRLEVRQYILDNVRMWLNDCHVDGLRFDSTIFMRNVEGRNDDPGNDIPEGWSLLQDITKLARKISPGALLAAEDVSGNEYITKSAMDGGAGFSSQWEVNLPYVLRSALSTPEDAGRNLSEVCNALSRKYNGDAFQRVIYSDSHDSAANGGARLSETITPGNNASMFSRRRSLLATALILTAPGIPMLFQGQEFMEGGSFNDWQALDWHRAKQFEGIVLANKHLIALRKNLYGSTKGLTGHSFTVIHLNEEAKLLAYHRWDKGGAGDDVIVICNFANKTQKDYEINFPRKGKWTVRFNSDFKGYSPDFKNTGGKEIMVENDKGSFTIGPYSTIILSQD